MTLNADDKKLLVETISSWYKSLLVQHVQKPSITDDNASDVNAVSTEIVPGLREEGLLADVNKLQCLVNDRHSKMDTCSFVKKNY